ARSGRRSAPRRPGRSGSGSSWFHQPLEFRRVRVQVDVAAVDADAGLHLDHVLVEGPEPRLVGLEVHPPGRGELPLGQLRRFAPETFAARHARLPSWTTVL